ncbi:MAG: TetR/AcrR family transcriptional regulator [Sporolactobacillus sp.]
MKNDRRFQKTEKEIRHAFIQLLGEKGFEKLTVHDIATSADINQATFYQHYPDKYALLESCENDYLCHAEALIQPLLSVDLVALYQSGKPIPALEKMLAYHKENSELLLGLLNNGIQSSFHDRLFAAALAHLETVTTQSMAAPPDFPLHYIAAYIINAHFSIVIEWLKSGAHESIAEMADLMTRLTIRGPFRDSWSGMKKLNGHAPSPSCIIKKYVRKGDL